LTTTTFTPWLLCLFQWILDLRRWREIIDMSTSISAGSGPAYIFLLMEAMIDAIH
jgi:pyrroline-5-carboxylate reductase